MDIRTRIWNEMAQAKHKSCYIVCVTDHQRSVSKWFNIFILVFSGSGVLGWKIWQSVPVVSCFIVACMSLIKLLQPQLIFSEAELTKADELNSFFSKYFNSLEALWGDFRNNRIDDKAAQERFYAIKETEEDATKEVNKIIRGKNKKIQKKAIAEAENYFSLNYKS